MPTCKKYFDELADCLLASDCVKINKKKPTDCLASLLKAKVFDARLLNDKINHLETDLTKFEIEDDAPRECKLKHQSYVECKVSLMNPRTRFRGAYDVGDGTTMTRKLSPMDPLQGVKKQVGEFEDFVDSFSSKMDAILNGTMDIEQLDQIPDRDSKTMIKINEMVKKKRDLGNVKFRSQEYELALEDYKEAIKISQNPKKYIEIDTKDPFAFVDRLTMKPVPVDPLLYVNRALCYFKLQKWEECIKECEDAILIDGYCVKAWYRKSEAQKQLLQLEGSLKSLEMCRECFQNNPELEKQVSKFIVEREIVEVTKLVEDQRIASQEREQLLNDPSSILLDQLLNTLGTAHVVENVIVMLDTHSSMQHAFRLLNGFERVVKVACKRWYDILFHACTKNKENLRELCVKMDMVLDSVLTNQDGDALGVLLELGKEYDGLLLKLSKNKTKTLKLGEMMVKLLETGSVTSKMRVYTFLQTQLEEKVGLKTVWGISIDLFLQYCAKQIEKVESKDLNELCVDLVYKATLNPLKIVQQALISNSNRIVQGLSVLLAHKLNTSELNTKVIAVLFNTVCKDDCNRYSILKETGLIPRLVRLMNDQYRNSLRLLAKLTIHNSKTVQEYTNSLDWVKCMDVLRLFRDDDSAEIGDWLQLLLVHVKDQPLHIEQFIELKGLDCLTALLQQCLKEPHKHARIIGNTSLVLSHCANNEANQGLMIEKGILVLVIELLRILYTNKAVAKNLGICCAKLYRHGIEIAREMKVIELLYSAQ